ncbi:hypothetical protein [Aeoliella mucimassa]|uniref:RedB protein n=1 Tax=Aeoliella mucimassa TaxID=2527972 RepID=A0A518AR34_9BACT|nr:hypothetical protein [Aeoliella mucimassa]QDU57175.1 hypothetical protein Pan181_33890 [Aeoliella mucimassa]
MNLEKPNIANKLLRPWWLYGLVALWAVAVAGGFYWLYCYNLAAGPEVDPPLLSTVSLEWNSTPSYRLVVAIHPKCPCTFATIDELNRVLRDAEGAIECKILAYEPADHLEEFQGTKLLEYAEKLPYTQVESDIDGKLAKQLSLHTSGAVVLYNQWGTPFFSGGVTVSRGHEGISPGGESILAIVRGNPPAVRRTPVYGCPIIEACEESCDLSELTAKQ